MSVKQQPLLVPLKFVTRISSITSIERSIDSPLLKENAMARDYRKVSWNGLNDYPDETCRIYSGPLACKNFAFLVNRQVPGDTGVMHSHEEAEEVYVLLSGQGNLRVNDEVIPMVPLDAVRVAPRVEHTTSNTSDSDAMWLVIGSPVDEFMAWDPVAYGPPKGDD